MMRVLSAALVLVSFAVSADPIRIVDGNYLRYDATGFNSLFLPCQSEEVWSIEGGTASESLVDYYRNHKTSASAEIRVTLMLSVSPIDRIKHPGSQVEATARVNAILSISEDAGEIAGCRQTSA